MPAVAVFPSMVADQRDPQQQLLVKICYYLQTAAESLGGSNAMTPFPSMTATTYDPMQLLLVKIAYWSKQIADNAGGGGGGGTAGVTPGAGDPAIDGSITTLFYKDTSTGFIYINTGTTASPTWDPI